MFDSSDDYLIDSMKTELPKLPEFFVNSPSYLKSKILSSELETIFEKSFNINEYQKKTRDTKNAKQCSSLKDIFIIEKPNRKKVEINFLNKSFCKPKKKPTKCVIQFYNKVFTKN